MGIIRFLLAVSVIISHSTPIFGISLVGGQIAVQAFFILSGFYMALVLNEKYIGENRSYKLFITNRLLRLYPLYWTVLAITILFFVTVLIFAPDNSNSVLYNYIKYNENLGLSSYLLLAFSNVFILLQDAVMFLGLNTDGNLVFTSNFNTSNPMLWTFLFVPQAWSISIEIMFYIIAPFLFRKNFILISALLVLTFLVRFLFYRNGFNQDPWSYRFFPFELGYFLLGGLSYHLYIKIKTFKISKKVPSIFFGTIVLTSLNYQHISYIGSYIYLLLFAICIPFVFILTKSSKLDSYIGNLSYPMYISHIFIYSVVRVINIPHVKNSGIKLTFITLFFSIILHEVISRKIEVLRQRRLHTKVFKTYSAG